MKRLFLLLFFIFSTSLASAQTLMVSSPGDGYLNLRSEPSSSSQILVEMYHGKSVQVLEESGNWLRVRTPDGNVGWAYSNNLVAFSADQSSLMVNSPNDGYLNLREGPSTSYEIIREMAHGTRTDILDRSGDWLKVRHDSGHIGWAHSRYLILNTASTTVASSVPENRPSSSTSDDEALDLAIGIIGIAAGIFGAGVDGLISSGS